MTFRQFLCTKVIANTNSWETKDSMLQWAGLFQSREKVAMLTNRSFFNCVGKEKCKEDKKATRLGKVFD